MWDYFGKLSTSNTALGVPPKGVTGGAWRTALMLGLCKIVSLSEKLFTVNICNLTISPIGAMWWCHYQVRSAKDGRRRSAANANPNPTNLFNHLKHQHKSKLRGKLVNADQSHNVGYLWTQLSFINRHILIKKNFAISPNSVDTLLAIS